MRPIPQDITVPMCICTTHHFKKDCYYSQPEERRQWNEYIASLPDVEDVYNNLANPEDIHT